MRGKYSITFRMAVVLTALVLCFVVLVGPAVAELITDETEEIGQKTHGDTIVFQVTIQWHERDTRGAPILIIDPGTSNELWVAMDQAEHTDITTANSTTFVAEFTIADTMASGTHHYKIFNLNSGLRTNPVKFEIGKPLALWSIIAGIIQLILGLVLAMLAIYLGIKLLDRFLPNLELLKELTHGNLAIGLVLIGVVFSMGNVIKSGIGAIGRTVIGEAEFASFFMALIGIAIGIVMAVVGIYLALKILVRITPDIPIEKKLKENNIAVGAITLGVLVAVSFVVEAGATGISNTLVGI